MPFHHGKAKLDTAEQLKLELEKIIEHANRSFLKIIGKTRGGKEDKRGKVEFIADYFVDGVPYERHEQSRFKRYKAAWKYPDGKA